MFAAWQLNPEVTWRQRLISFFYDHSDLVIGDQLPFVWLEYRIAPTDFSGSTPTTIPYRFQNIVAYAAAGQMLKVDGKLDLGNEMLLLSEASLSDEIDKASRQEMQTRQVVYQGR